MGKSTISMVIFNSYVKLPEGNHHDQKKPPHRWRTRSMAMQQEPKGTDSLEAPTIYKAEK